MPWPAGRGGPDAAGPGLTLALHPADLPAAAREFLAERHLATLTTLRPDGSPHVVPVAFTWDDGALVARVIASGDTRKVRNAEAGCRAVLCQVDGRRWLSLEGTGRTSCVTPRRCSTPSAATPSVSRPAAEPPARGAARHRGPGHRRLDGRDAGPADG